MLRSDSALLKLCSAEQRATSQSGIDNVTPGGAEDSPLRQQTIQATKVPAGSGCGTGPRC